MTYSVFGYTPQLRERWERHDPRPCYVVVARCDAGCHTTKEWIDEGSIPAIWPTFEQELALAFQRAHPDA